MKCKYCGKDALSSDKFCKYCGAEIEKIESQPKVEEINFNSSPIEMKDEQNTNNSQAKSNKKGNGLKIASLVLGIISLVLFIFNILLLPLEIIGLVLAIVYIAKNKKFCAGLVLNIIAMIISLLLFSAGIAIITNIGENLINYPDDEVKEQIKEQIENLKNELEEYDKINIYYNDDEKYEEGYKYVGSDEYGYIKVPNNWNRFIDVDGNNTIQYSYGNMWIATIYGVDTEEFTTYKYAQNVFNNVKNDGVTNLRLTMETIADKYYAYKISCYYPDYNVYLNCWVFEDENDVKHYISIEGPEKINDYYDLINTFTTEKE